MKRMIVRVALAGAAFLASGCALPQDQVQIHYLPQGKTAAVEGAGDARVRVEVRDARKRTDRVSSRKNSLGMETAAIVSENDPAQVLGEALESELRSRGFALEKGGAQMQVVLGEFYNDFKMGVWSGDAVADLIMSVQVRTVQGDIVFAELVRGDHTNRGVVLMSGPNAKAALDQALRKAVEQLIENPKFIAALLFAGRPERAQAQAAGAASLTPRSLE